jgi:hypothetical protein
MSGTPVKLHNQPRENNILKQVKNCYSLRNNVIDVGYNLKKTYAKLEETIEVCPSCPSW